MHNLICNWKYNKRILVVDNRCVDGILGVMTTPNEQRILIKIKKLQAMCDSATEIGNEAEALAFASRIQQLLHSYKLDVEQLDDVDLDTPETIEVDQTVFDWNKSGIKDTSKRSAWLMVLSSYVCKYNGCAMYTLRGSNRICIIGTEASRTVCGWLLTTLARFGKEQAESTYRAKYYAAKKQGDTSHLKGYTKSFLVAFARAVGDRLEAAYLETQSACTERGLAIIDTEAAAVESFKSTLGLTSGKAFTIRKNVLGEEAGKEAAKKATIDCNGVGSDPSNTRLL